jgi:ABC-2 type transport system permease protein
MNKLFYVARFEFIRHIKRRGFIFAVVGLPAILVGVSVLVALFFGGNAGEPVGVLDQSGLLLDLETYTPIDENDPPIFTYDVETAARQALSNDEVQAYFVVSEDYLETGQVIVYHEGNPNDSIYSAFRDYARASLLRDADSAVTMRFREGTVDVNFISLAEENESPNPLEAILPFIFGFMIIMAIFTTGGYLLQAVVDEKENRTMEILATSVRPSYLMIGKILGLVTLGFVQLSIWAAGATAVFLYFRGRVPELAALTFPTETAVLALVGFIAW